MNPNRNRARLPGLVPRPWRRLLRLRVQVRLSEDAVHLFLAAGVGVIGGLVNLGYYHAVESVKYLFLRHAGDPAEIAEMAGPWTRALMPAIGGLVAGLILQWGLRLVGPRGPDNLLEVVVAGDGRLPFRANVIKFLSSLVTMGTGGSIGREGGIIQLAATLASKWGQWAKWPPHRLRLLVACGAASGVAAAYNAPISGAVFAAWIVLGNFSMNLFAPVVCASVISTTVSRTFFGLQPWYSVPPVDFSDPAWLPWFLPLGMACGAAGALFLKSLRASEEAFRRGGIPLPLRLAAGGLVVGAITLKFPGVWGNGYYLANRILRDTPGLVPDPATGWRSLPLYLPALLLAKWLATSATVGSGAVGGVLTPTLFLGAGVGAGFGLLVKALGAARGLPAAAFALAGMGGMLSATTRSPLLAVILVFEISLDYSLVLPLMLTCVVAAVTAGGMHQESVYTEPLRRKRLALGPIRAGADTGKTVGEVMRPPVPPLPEGAGLRDIAARFLTTPYNFLPVVDGEGRLVGLLALQDLKEFLRDPALPGPLIAYDLMRPPAAVVTPGQPLSEVLPLALASEQRNIPVVDGREGMRLIGSLPRAEVLHPFSEAIAASGAREA